MEFFQIFFQIISFMILATNIPVNYDPTPNFKVPLIFASSAFSSEIISNGSSCTEIRVVVLA